MTLPHRVAAVVTMLSLVLGLGGWSHAPCEQDHPSAPGSVRGAPSATMAHHDVAPASHGCCDDESGAPTTPRAPDGGSCATPAHCALLAPFPDAPTLGIDASQPDVILTAGDARPGDRAPEPPFQPPRA